MVKFIIVKDKHLNEIRQFINSKTEYNRVINEITKYDSDNCQIMISGPDEQVEPYFDELEIICMKFDT